jgi:transcriptional regulator NrdR family protein
MIVCPICGLATAVVETRATGSGARRRRKCTDLACTGRVTTVEIVVSELQSANEFADGRALLVSRKMIIRLQRAVAALGGDS